MTGRIRSAPGRHTTVQATTCITVQISRNARTIHTTQVAHVARRIHSGGNPRHKACKQTAQARCPVAYVVRTLATHMRSSGVLRRLHRPRTVPMHQSSACSSAGERCSEGRRPVVSAPHGFAGRQEGCRLASPECGYGRLPSRLIRCARPWRWTCGSGPPRRCRRRPAARPRR